MSPWPVQLSTQEPDRVNQKAIPTEVQSVAEKALDAMRNKDAEFLSRLADRAGVYIGTDGPKMSASRFGRELLEKRGVYCVILDSSCLKGNGEKSETQYSLRQILIQQPVTVNIASVEGAPEVRAAVVKKARSPNEILFTLVFRHVEGNWKLQQIEYE
jgi:hypothetical protein